MTSPPSSSLRVVAEDDDADLGLFEVQRQAGDAAAEVEHLVQHHVAEPFDLGDAVADLADDADALLGRRGLGAGDLRFDFLDQVGHDRPTSLRVTSRASSAASLRAHAAVVDVAADLDPHAADQRRVVREGGVEPGAVHRAPGWPATSARRSSASGAALSTTARVPVAIEPHQALKVARGRRARRDGRRRGDAPPPPRRTRASSSAPSTRHSRNSCRARAASSGFIA